MRLLPALTDGWSLPRGSRLMLIGTLMFVAKHPAIRHTIRQLPTAEAAFFCNLFGLLVIAPRLLRRPSPMPIPLACLEG